MTALLEPRPVERAIAKEAGRLFDLPPYEIGVELARRLSVSSQWTRRSAIAPAPRHIESRRKRGERLRRLTSWRRG